MTKSSNGCSNGIETPKTSFPTAQTSKNESSPKHMRDMIRPSRTDDRLVGEATIGSRSACQRSLDHERPGVLQGDPEERHQHRRDQRVRLQVLPSALPHDGQEDDREERRREERHQRVGVRRG